MIERRVIARLTASLTRRFGAQHLARVEDAVHHALERALVTWPDRGVPTRQEAWLYRVAHNALVDELRKRARETDDALVAALAIDPAAASLQAELDDDLLRMLFVACDDALDLESQLIFTLKILAGFTTDEIAAQLFCTKAKVYKRTKRAAARLAERAPSLTPSSQQISARIPAVCRVLYAIFTEGHLSSHDERGIRDELIVEAERLCRAMLAHPLGDVPEVRALLALMLLHRARLDARSAEGLNPWGVSSSASRTPGLMLLEEQDRSRFDRALIDEGLMWLSRSASGEYTRFHAEAEIAAEHALAPSFRATRWGRIAKTYEALEHLAPSALHRLNRALALAEAEGARAGIDLLAPWTPPTWLAGSHMWWAVLADLHARVGDREESERLLALALSDAPANVAPLIARRVRGRLT